MDRIWSWLGCFGLLLLAILFVLGVTEAIKYVSPLERTLVLTAAVLAAAAVAFLRDWRKKGAASALHNSKPDDEPTKQERSDSLPQTTALPIHDALLDARRQAILFRQIVPPKFDPTHLSFFGGLLQFWIRPDDLAARRFDRVEFSATAY